MEIVKIIWIAALIICSLGLIASFLAAIIVWKNGHKDRLKYILPLIPITLAGVIESLFSISHAFH
jgi:hypothetical protein